MKSGRIRLSLVIALSLFSGALAAPPVFAGSPPAPPALPGPPPGVLLSAWNFNDTNWLSSRGYAPLSFTNIDNVDDWDRNALQVDNSDPAWLAYRGVENDGHTNLTCDRGTISFWFIPNWESTNVDGGTGPSNWAQLIDVGMWTSNATYGWWSLYLNPAGTSINFSAQTNGAGVDYLNYPISWDWNTWHLITLTYSSTNSLLYLDGQVATNGAGVVYLPPDAALTNGFFIGSGNTGLAQAHGLFEDLRTYSYQLDAVIISNYYAGVLPDLPTTGGFSMDGSSPPFPGDGTNGSGGGVGFSGLGGPIFGTNDLNLNIVGLSSAHDLSYLVIYPPWNETNGVWDMFGTTNLAFSVGGLNLTNWVWVLRTGIWQTNVTATNFSITDQSYFRLGTMLDSDGDGLTDAYERLVSHTDPNNSDSDGDGISDGYEYLYGSPPAGVPTLAGHTIYSCPIP